ncbi:DUF3019 domain-containing protein [Colwelliaceae bacterium 6471]
MILFRSLGLFIFCTQIAWAADGGQLLVTPQICVIDQGRQACQTVINIHYQSETLGDYCAVVDSFDIRRCYLQVNQFELNVDVNTNKSVQINIEELQSNDVIVRAKMDVVIYKPKKTRKRRNFGWNFL